MKFLGRLLGLIVGLFVLGLAGIGLWGWAPDLPRDELVAKYGQGNSQFVELSSGITVHLRDEGCSTCPAVFLTHGSNASLHTWERWASQLGERWRVVSFDLPGHGLTGATLDGDYSIDRAAEVIEEVRDHLGIEQMHLAGNSRGGSISLRYGVDHAERLLSLSLLNASGAPWPAPDPDAETDQPFIYTLLENQTVAQALKNFLPRPLLEEAIRNAFSNQDAVTEVMIERYHDLLRYPGNRDASLLRSQMPYAIEAYGEAGSLTLPVLIMWGDEDNLVPLALSDRFLEVMPHAERIVYPHVGHAPMEEIPEQSATDFEVFILAATSASQADGDDASDSADPVHEPGMALFGYYMPANDSEIRIGDWQLQDLFIDDAVEADAWTPETGLAYFAPMMLEFVDTSSEWVETEIGGGYSGFVRALPTRFAVTESSVFFEGRAEGLGPVSFNGTYNRDAVLAAQDIGSTEAIVIEGRLSIGDQVFDAVQFSWFAGD
jgi:pimeloyl-ACP methyl ester carboxylesterase